MHLIIPRFPPEPLHVKRCSAVIVCKISEDHLIILMLFKQVKADICKEIIVFIIILADILRTQAEDLFLRIILQSLLFYDVKSKFFLFLIVPVFHQPVQIFSAQVHIAQLIEQPFTLIWDGVGIMSAILSLPHKPVRLCIQEYSCTIFQVRRLLCDRSILGDHMDIFHIGHLRSDPVCMADIVKCPDPLRIHGRLHKKSLVNDPELFIHIPALQLAPRKRLHLIPVVGVDLACLILISDQI